MAPSWWSGFEGHYRIGENLFREGQVGKAIEEFSKAIELDQDHVGVYLCRGISYYRLADYGNAVADINKAIELKPKHADAYYCRGACYRELGKHEDALADLDKAVDLDPRDDFAYTVRGSTYHFFGEHRRALTDFDRAIDIDPENGVAFYCRGVLHMALNKYREAVEDFNNALEPNPKYRYGATRVFDSTTNQRKSNTETTEPEPLQWDMSIAINDDDSTVYVNRGYAFMQSYSHKEAVADFNKATVLNPENAIAYLYRWDFLREIRQRCEGI